MMGLIDGEISVAETVMSDPRRTLPLLDVALVDEQRKYIAVQSVERGLTVKTNVHVRFRNLPACPELFRFKVPKARDNGRFLAFSGTVIRTTEMCEQLKQKSFQCSKCAKVMQIAADDSVTYGFPEPPVCPFNEDNKCLGAKFIPLEAEGAIAVI